MEILEPGDISTPKCGRKAPVGRFLFLFFFDLEGYRLAVCTWRLELSMCGQVLWSVLSMGPAVFIGLVCLVKTILYAD